MTETLEQTHEAVVVSDTPIQFDITTAAVAEMQQKADSLSISGPDDKQGFKEVYEYRQVVRKQRLSLEKRADALKQPHKDYIKRVDSAADSLVASLKSIESNLAIQEKVYNDERERIAHERAMFLQNRMEARVQQLRAWGFVWNANDDLYEWKEPTGEIGFFITFEDIKELDDDAYEPTRVLAEQCYTEHQAWLKQQAELAKRERERIEAEQKAEADRLAEIDRQQKEREAELRAAEERIRAQEQAIRDAEAKLEAERVAREKAEADRIAAEKAESDRKILAARKEKLAAVGFSENTSGIMVYVKTDWYFRESELLALTDEQVEQAVLSATRMNEEARQAEIDRQKAEQEAEQARIKADKDRQKRLAPEKEKLRIYLESAGDLIDPKLKQPEAVEFLAKFDESLSTLVTQYLALLESL